MMMRLLMMRLMMMRLMMMVAVYCCYCYCCCNRWSWWKAMLWNPYPHPASLSSVVAAAVGVLGADAALIADERSQLPEELQRPVFSTWLLIIEWPPLGLFNFPKDLIMLLTKAAAHTLAHLLTHPDTQPQPQCRPRPPTETLSEWALIRMRAVCLSLSLSISHVVCLSHQRTNSPTNAGDCMHAITRLNEQSRCIGNDGLLCIGPTLWPKQPTLGLYGAHACWMHKRPPLVDAENNTEPQIQREYKIKYTYADEQQYRRTDNQNDRPMSLWFENLWHLAAQRLHCIIAGKIYGRNNSNTVTAFYWANKWTNEWTNEMTNERSKEFKRNKELENKRTTELRNERMKEPANERIKERRN